jgi:hypothetical protein
MSKTGSVNAPTALVFGIVAWYAAESTCGSRGTEAPFCKSASIASDVTDGCTLCRTSSQRSVLATVSAMARASYGWDTHPTFRAGPQSVTSIHKFVQLSQVDVGGVAADRTLLRTSASALACEFDKARRLGCRDLLLGTTKFVARRAGAQPALPNSASQLKPVHRRLPSVRILTQNARRPRPTKPHTRERSRATELLVLVLRALFLLVERLEYPVA